MRSTSSKRSFQIFGATISWFAIVIQYFLMLDNSEASLGETTIRFFSYFTILTNLLVAAYFTFMNADDHNLKRLFDRPGTITAIAVYISVVGLVYQIVLRETWEPEGLQMVVDEFLHSGIPVYFVIYWFLFEDKQQVKWQQAPLILIYPLIYVVYILWQGEYSGFYPYPFINVAMLGFDKVISNSFTMLCIFLIVIVIFIGLGKLIDRSDT